MSGHSERPDRLVVVTGATGFVGRHLVRTLSERGNRVRGISRTLPAVGRPPVEWRRIADVTDRESVRSALEDAAAVVHLASRVHVMKEKEPDPLRAFRETNVEGTRVVLEESVRAGADTFLFMSSVKAVAEESQRPLTEKVEPEPEDPYGVSKLEAEELALDLGAGDLRVLVLRPPLVYGPGMKGNLLRLFHAVGRGIPLPIGGIENRRSLVYTGNLVAAIGSLLEHRTARGRFFVSDGRDLSTPELVEEIARAMSRKARLWSVPPSLIEAGVWVGHAVSAIPGVPDPAPLHRRLTGSLQVSSERLRREAGYNPPYELVEGLKRTAEWFIESRRARSGSP